jgi:hypothetical protein
MLAAFIRHLPSLTAVGVGPRWQWRSCSIGIRRILLSEAGESRTQGFRSPHTSSVTRLATLSCCPLTSHTHLSSRLLLLFANCSYIFRIISIFQPLLCLIMGDRQINLRSSRAMRPTLLSRMSNSASISEMPASLLSGITDRGREDELTQSSSSSTSSAKSEQEYRQSKLSKSLTLFQRVSTCSKTSTARG